MARSDVEDLRAAGFDDRAILDAIQVVSYFNYINRLADAVHVDVEPEMTPYPGES
jgi:alkylhydroperoxidase family enzyme